MKIWLKLFVAVSSFGITTTNIIACSQNESNSDNQNKITNPKQPTIPVYPNIPVNPNLPNQPTIPVYPNLPVDPNLPNQPTIPVYPNIPVNPNLPQWPTIPVYPNIPAKEELDKVLLHKEVNGYIATNHFKAIKEVIRLNQEINIMEKDIEVIDFISADIERAGLMRLKSTKTSKWIGETIILITKLEI